MGDENAHDEQKGHPGRPKAQPENPSYHRKRMKSVQRGAKQILRPIHCRIYLDRQPFQRRPLLFRVPRHRLKVVVHILRRRIVVVGEFGSGAEKRHWNDRGSHEIRLRMLHPHLNPCRKIVPHRLAINVGSLKGFNRVLRNRIVS